MKRQLIEDFLNLPGIVGLALMDGQFRSYSYGLSLPGEDQQQLLAQGLQQILATTPSELENFSFQFAQHSIFLYKVDRGMCFLTLTQGSLSQDYSKSVAQIKRFMKADFESVATGLMMAVSPVLAFDENGPISQPLESLEAHNAMSLVNNNDKARQFAYNGDASNEFANGTSPHYSRTSTAAGNDAAMTMTRQETVFIDFNTLTPATVSEVLVAMNQLSQFTIQYLGKFIVANHWRTNCPDVDWLRQFIVAPTGTLSLDVRSKLMGGDLLSDQQQAWIRAWVSGFSQRCTKVIRDYPTLVHQQALDQNQWQLLFEPEPISPTAS
jgi:hypothetical protein